MENKPGWVRKFTCHVKWLWIIVGIVIANIIILNEFSMNKDDILKDRILILEQNNAEIKAVMSFQAGVINENTTKIDSLRGEIMPAAFRGVIRKH